MGVAPSADRFFKRPGQQHQSQHRPGAELKTDVVQIQRLPHQHRQHGHRQHLHGVQRAGQQHAHPHAQAQQDRPHHRRGGQRHRPVSHHKSHHDQRRRAGAAKDHPAAQVDKPAENGHMHAADAQMVARAGADELLLHVAQLRIAIPDQQRPQQRMIQPLPRIKPRPQQLPSLPAQRLQPSGVLRFQNAHVFHARHAHRRQDSLLPVVSGPVELSRVHRRSHRAEHAQNANALALSQSRVRLVQPQRDLSAGRFPSPPGFYPQHACLRRLPGRLGPIGACLRQQNPRRLVDAQLQLRQAGLRPGEQSDMARRVAIRLKLRQGRAGEENRPRQRHMACRAVPAQDQGRAGQHGGPRRPPLRAGGQQAVGQNPRHQQRHGGHHGSAGHAGGASGWVVGLVHGKPGWQSSESSLLRKNP